jgi:UDP-N-acetylmuramate--alanine ligase
MKIHLIGIGGIGISGLAQYLYKQGHIVSGSDQKVNRITKDLEKIGIKINVPHSANVIIDQDLIIHSAIIHQDNIEVIEARKRGIEILPRNEALKKILTSNRIFSICGAHGKSTTTAILSVIIDSSSIVGAYNKYFGSNMHYRSDLDEVVFEADESDGSFLNSNPYFAIVTNAEPEHMEYYNYDFDKFYSSYKKFLEIAPYRVFNAEDPFLSTLDIVGTRLYPSKDIFDLNSKIIDDEPFLEFSLKNFGKFAVWGFGFHVAIDASLAILTALDYGLELETIRTRILRYRGTEKRFDILQKNNNFILIDDYGHHPTEIEVTLQSAFEYSKMMNVEKIIAIWQPHKYSRTIDNINHFISCFAGISRLIILPVWEAGELPVYIDFAELFKRYNLTFSDKIIVKNGVITLSDGEEINSGLIIGFGAGDITYQLRGKI